MIQKQRCKPLFFLCEKMDLFQILKEIAEYQMQILSAADKISCIEEKNEV